MGDDVPKNFTQAVLDSADALREVEGFNELEIYDLREMTALIMATIAVLDQVFTTMGVVWKKPEIIEEGE